MFLLLSSGKNMFLFLIFESYKQQGIFNFYQEEICFKRYTKILEASLTLEILQEK